MHPAPNSFTNPQSLFESQERVTLFADVILPVPVPNLFTYRIPLALNDLVKVGARVVVQFGSSRVLTAIIAKVHHLPPQKYTAKYVLELLDEEPVVTTRQLELFRWTADYYMCTVGEVMNAALPSGLKISSESKIQYNPDFDTNPIELTEEETMLLDAVKQKQALPYDEAVKMLGVKEVHKVVKSLTGKRAVILFEEVREKYRPKIVKKVRLKRIYEQRDNLEALFKILESKPKQLDIVLKYLRHIPILTSPGLNEAGLDKSLIAKDEISTGSLKTLLKNQILEEFEIIKSRFEDLAVSDFTVELSLAQKEAETKIIEEFKTKDTVLLHGVTGSGKTQIYISLIQKVLDSGSQVLYLLPEIALTTQIVNRLRKVFGDQLGIYHSRFSDNERVEVWQGILSGKYQFVIGVRSAIFLPFDNLGLIIVDEEHEASYKQHDPAPRYNARDLSLVVARFQGAKVLLGSATPAFESFNHAQSGRYGYVKLAQRYGEAQLPELVLVDLRRERKQKKIKHRFSSVLLDEIRLVLGRNEQTILFQNRRGYAPYVMCEECNWIPHCGNCAVSLTFHLHNQELRCHYCGYHESLPALCPACGTPKIKTIGYGTEKIEDELKLLLPEARLGRMDLDTTRQKNAYQQIIQAFEAGEMDVLIGTQMISKGLDFDRVNMVGIFDADSVIHFPDFRAHERAFQLLTQVSGRAGRRDKKGKVIIQTGDPKQLILQKMLEDDYEGMYEREMEERQKFHYPPFTRMIRLTVKHIDPRVADAAAQELASRLQDQLGTDRVLGPESPLVDRIRAQYLKDIIIKLERENVNLKAVKDLLRTQLQTLILMKRYKQVTIVADVDPM